MLNKFKTKVIVAIVSFAMVAGVVGVGVAPSMVSADTNPVPVGYEKISGPSEISQYTNIIKYPGSDDLYGKPRSVSSAATTVATTATSNTGILGSGNSSLGNLLILDRVFGGGMGTTGSGILGSSNNLGNLLVLDQLFNGTSDGSGIFGSSNTSNGSLGDLLILDSIFGGNSSGSILGGTTGGATDLGNLMILNQLFNN